MDVIPFFSLIVPVYNVERYLEQCLESIVHQSFRNYELILINDGSTDTSLSICQRYADSHPNIKIINQDNSGVSIARNNGIKASKGNYIWFVDSDDYIADNALQILFDHLIHTDVEMLGFSNYHYHEDENVIKENLFNGNTTALTPKSFFDKGYVFETAPWIMVIKNAFLKENNLLFDPDLIIYEDNLFMMNCLSKSKLIQYIDALLYYYRIRNNSLTAMNKVESVSLKGYIELLKFNIKASRTSDIQDYWNTNIYQYLNNVYHIYFKLDEIEKQKYVADIEEIKKHKLKFCKSDALGIKMMKVFHNYCFPLYKTKLLKA